MTATPLRESDVAAAPAPSSHDSQVGNRMAWADRDPALRGAPDRAARDVLSVSTRSRLVQAQTTDVFSQRRLWGEVVVDYLWMARTMARRFAHRGIDGDDLVQVARVGLLEACARFDPDRGVFTPFAAATVNGVLRRHFRDHGWTVRPPRDVQELALNLRQEWSILAQARGQTPTDATMADHLGQTPGAVRTAQLALDGYHPAGIDVTDATTGYLDAGFEDVENRSTVAALLARLNTADQTLLRLRFWEQRTQSDIGDQLGISQMQVSRNLAQLLARLHVNLDQADEAGHDETVHHRTSDRTALAGGHGPAHPS